MKKSILAAIVLVAALACVILASRRAAKVATAAEEVPAAPLLRADITATKPEYRKATARVPMLTFSPETLARTVKSAEDAAETPSKPSKARDWFYDRLLLRQGRDPAKEQQLTSTMMAVFGDRVDTLVGSTSCSSQFCRVELRGFGRVDIRESWRPEVMSAVDPKGLNFFIVNGDDDGNTIMNFYFGRDESWTVPDFHALGML